MGKVIDLPMESVMTFNLFRTSLTTMLFCRGVARQHKTDRQCLVSSKNFVSRPPWKITFNVLPSITSPTSGRAISCSGTVCDLCLLKRRFFFFSGEIFLTSSRVQSIMDSQVSYNTKNILLSDHLYNKKVWHIWKHALRTPFLYWWFMNHCGTQTAYTFVLDI